MGGKIKENRISENLLSSVDVFPTILGLCGINNDRNTPGKDLAPALLDDSVPVPEHEFTFSETGGLQGPFPSPNKHNVFCVKNKNYKLIYYKDKEEKLLYDLLNDSSETKNLYGNGLEIQRVLEEKLSDYMK